MKYLLQGFIALLTIFSLLATACKPFLLQKSKEKSSELLDKSSTKKSAAPEIAILKPVVESRAAGITVEKFLELLAREGVTNLKQGDLSILQLANGESVLLMKNELGITAVASVLDGKLYEWEMQAPGEIKGEELRVLGTNFAFRHEVGNDKDISPYIIYETKDGSPLVVHFGDHNIATNGTFRRSANRIYSDVGTKIFEYRPVSDHAWKLQGDVYNGYICSGSVIWQDEKSFYSVTTEFDRKTVSRWEDRGETLVLIETLADVPVPAAILNAHEPCPFNKGGDLQAIINKLDYQLQFNEQPDPKSTDANIVDFEIGKAYRTGQRVRYEDSVWLLLEAIPEKSHYIFANDMRTFGEDQGRKYTRIFRIVPSSRKLVEIASTPLYLTWAATRIHALSDNRIDQQDVISESQKNARRQLSIAEVKAKVVGAGFDEWYKPILFGVSTYIFDKGAQVSSSGTVLGVATAKSTLGAAAAQASALSQRMLAGLYLTALQGASISMQIAAANLKTKDVSEHLASVREITGYSGIVNGLRSAFPSKSVGGIILTTASGVAMRWRKINADTQLGYVNKNNLANLAAGGLTAVSVVAVQNKGSGAVAAVGKAGVLLSEIIAGRGSIGVIAGTGIEIAADLLVVHPVIRPFSSTLAAQLSALTQLGEAKIMADSAGGEIDKARWMIREQAQKANTIILLSRLAPEQLMTLSAQELGLVLTTAQDPFLKYRQQMRVE